MMKKLLAASALAALMAIPAFAEDKAAAPDASKAGAAAEAAAKAAADMQKAAEEVAKAAAEEAKAVAEALKKFNGDSVVATVGGVNVTLADMALAYSGLGPQAHDVPSQEIFDVLKDQIVTEAILASAAEKAGIADEPETKRRLAAVRRATLAETYIARELGKRLTDDMVKKEYDEKIGKAPVKEEVNARHILVKTEDEAKAIIADLKGGKDFAEIAKAKSEDKGSGADGGSLGWFEAETMVKEFSDAAFKLKKGEISAPVKSDFGWHVIKLEDRREVAKPKLEEVAPQIRQALTSKVVNEIVSEMKKAAKVEAAKDLPPPGVIRSPDLFKK